MIEWMTVFAVSTLTSWILVRVFREIALRKGILDRPGAHKGHAAPVPHLGGAGIASGLAVVVGGIALGILPCPSPPRHAGLLPWIAAGAAAALLTGLVDDHRRGGLRPAWKLAGQIAAAFLAAVGLAASGILAWGLPLDLATGAGCAALIVLVTNAFNLLDNMNGLCAGSGLLISLAFGVVLAPAAPAYSLACVILAGTLAGFLPQNYPTARVFLGDAGSHLIGYTVGVAAVLAPLGAAGDPSAIARSLVLLSLPLLDVLWVVIRRHGEGRPILVGDRGHLSHHLVAAGLAPPAAVAVLWGHAAFTAALALVAPAFGPPGIVAALGASAGSGALLAAYLAARRTPRE
jgi:UDP-GlcNAc:undecaprenyl-phosphate GlcNAc-1-phosphate transferase